MTPTVETPTEEIMFARHVGQSSIMHIIIITWRPIVPDVIQDRPTWIKPPATEVKAFSKTQSLTSL